MSGTFDKLAAELSMEERRDLYAKLSSQSELSKDLLFREEELPPTVDIEGRFKALPWYSRLFYFLSGIVKSKPPIKVYEDRLIARLGSGIEAKAPGLFDHRRSMLLPGFLDELRTLKEGGRFFYETLDAGFGKDKGAFFAFLASLEMDFIHRRLSTEADPQYLADVNTGLAETEIRQQAFKALEAILQTIDEDQRRVMYRNARALQCLKELSSFLFDRLMSAFSHDPSVDGPASPSYLVHDQLGALNNTLYSLQDPPSLTLLESLFVFVLQDRMTEAGFDMTAETRTLLSRAEEALSRIRQFNRRVPLTAIIRCSTRNLGYLPQATTGGEDWFAVYRDYWKRRIEDRYAVFLKARRREELADSFRQFLKGVTIRPLSNVASDANPDGIPVRGAFALSFLLAFFKFVFAAELNKALKPILIDGEFYKRENRAEFTEAYNELLKLGDAIQGFDARLSATGEYGKRFSLARSEITALSVKRRKIQAIVQEAADEGAALIASAAKSLKSLSAILGGVLNGEAGGRYDSLVNLGSLSGRGGTYIATLRNALQKIEKTVQLLGEIETMESGR